MTLRKCIIKEERKGYFHGWFQRSEVAAPNSFIGGHSGGQLQDVIGLVELEDGRMTEVIPFDLRFTDIDRTPNTNNINYNVSIDEVILNDIRNVLKNNLYKEGNINGLR